MDTYYTADGLKRTGVHHLCNLPMKVMHFSHKHRLLYSYCYFMVENLSASLLGNAL